MLKDYKVKKLSTDPENPEITTLKLACESAYLSLKLIFISLYPEKVPPFSFWELLNAVYEAGFLKEKEWL